MSAMSLMSPSLSSGSGDSLQLSLLPGPKDSLNDFDVNALYDVQDTNRMRRRDHIIAAANAALHTKGYFIAQAALIVLCLVTLVWTLLDPKSTHPGLWVVEGIIIVVMALEILVKLLAMGPGLYFRQASNWLDLIVLAVVLATLALYIVALKQAHNHAANVEEDIGMAAFILRTLAQVLRLSVIIKNQARKAKEQDIDIQRIRLAASGPALQSSALSLSSAADL